MGSHKYQILGMQRQSNGFDSDHKINRECFSKTKPLHSWALYLLRYQSKMHLTFRFYTMLTRKSHKTWHPREMCHQCTSLCLQTYLAFLQAGPFLHCNKSSVNKTFWCKRQWNRSYFTQVQHENTKQVDQTFIQKWGYEVALKKNMVL